MRYASAIRCASGAIARRREETTEPMIDLLPEAASSASSMCAAGQRGTRSASSGCARARSGDARGARGRDTLVALPTGFGKSLIYQVPAMILERPTIVVSPLIALMMDQERALRRRGVPVVAPRQPTAPGRAPRRARAARSRRPPRRPHHARDARVAEDRAADRARAAGAALRRRGALHLGVGPRLPSRVPAARRRARAAAATRRCWRSPRPRRRGCAATSPRGLISRSARARRPAAPREPAPERPSRARRREAPRRRLAASAGCARPGIIYCATTVAVDSSRAR